jgi:hypothetical protein
VRRTRWAEQKIKPEKYEQGIVLSSNQSPRESEGFSFITARRNPSSTMY